MSEPDQGRRVLRRRQTDAKNYAEDTDLDDILGAAPAGRKLGSPPRPDVAGLRRKLERGPAESPNCEVSPDLVLPTLLEQGFRRPVLVRAAAAGDTASTRRALGLQLPLQMLTPQGLADAVGEDFQVPTMDVHTQDSGPRMTLGELADYHATPPQERKRLLNVVSFSLADTPLAVRALSGFAHWDAPRCSTSPFCLCAHRKNL